jgi:purine nucleosidase
MSAPLAGRARIILDCDPGIDDALAILLALCAPERIGLLALTTVAGNVPLAATTRNAGRVLALAGHPEVPIHPGCARAIMGPIERGAEVHGADGLGGVALPEPLRPVHPRHAVDTLVETVMEAPPGAITLCVTGPMTNVALALIKEPAVAARLKALVFMGGAAFVSGNMGEAGVAEFNAFTDPHAAEIVLSAELPEVVMMGLDVTRQALVTREEVPPRPDGHRLSPGARALPGPAGHAPGRLRTGPDARPDRGHGTAEPSLRPADRHGHDRARQRRLFHPAFRRTGEAAVRP